MSYADWRDRLLEGIDGELYTPEFLDDAIANGAGFLSNDGGAIAFYIRVYPTGAKVLHGLCAAGELPAIKELITQAEAIGEREGCIRSMIESRPGWARAMKDYEIYQVCIMKEL